MAAKKTPGLAQLEAFVDHMGDVGVQVDDPRQLYKLGSQLLVKAYEIYGEQFARAPRKDKGQAKPKAK